MKLRYLIFLLALWPVVAVAQEPAAEAPDADTDAVETSDPVSLDGQLEAVRAGRLAESRSNEERLVKSMIIDGVSGIQEGRNPRVIEGMLMTYLPGSKRKGGDGEGEE